MNGVTHRELDRSWPKLSANRIPVEPVFGEEPASPERIRVDFPKPDCRRKRRDLTIRCDPDTTRQDRVGVVKALTSDAQTKLDVRRVGIEQSWVEQPVGVTEEIGIVSPLQLTRQTRVGRVQGVTV